MKYFKLEVIENDFIIFEMDYHGRRVGRKLIISDWDMPLHLPDKIRQCALLIERMIENTERRGGVLDDEIPLYDCNIDLEVK